MTTPPTWLGSPFFAIRLFRTTDDESCSERPPAVFPRRLLDTISTLPPVALNPPAVFPRRLLDTISTLPPVALNPPPVFPRRLLDTSSTLPPLALNPPPVFPERVLDTSSMVQPVDRMPTPGFGPMVASRTRTVGGPPESEQLMPWPLLVPPSRTVRPRIRTSAPCETSTSGLPMTDAARVASGPTMRTVWPLIWRCSL